MANQERRILTQDEAAKYLRLPVGTLVQYRSKGKGPRYYQLGDMIRYSVIDLNRWLNVNSANTDWSVNDGGE